MTPEISEFSYGFALTNEIVGWTPLKIAPIFPSLIEEGKTGGGYDVKLDIPGIPLYLQFKRADCMVRKNATEFIKNPTIALSKPFYRFKITESGKSNQHRLLLELSKNPGASVFYAAPRFHKLVEINQAWDTNEVASRSIFISPTAIGTLNAESHHVAYDNQNAFLFSEPKNIQFLTSYDLLSFMQRQLDTEIKPLKDTIPTMISNLDNAIHRVETGILNEQKRLSHGERLLIPTAAIESADTIESLSSIAKPISTRQSRPLSGSEQQLRQLSDKAAKRFNTQLIIIQKVEKV